MKKLLFFLVFSVSIFFTAYAGYVIRGINVSFSLNNLKNYTLTIDGDGNPRAAASLHTNLGISMGRNTIAIVPSYYSPFPVPCFPVFPNLEEDFDIEVRDFHYVSSNDTYVLCGARITSSHSYAFIAEIDLNAFPVPSMNYMEYSEADIFYSLCVPNNSSLDFYVCGNRNDLGVIASIDRLNLNFTHFLITNEWKWEYHKIIQHPTNAITPTFIVSGRDPECTQIGFTIFDLSFSSSNSYYWAELSEPDSHCVVCNHSTENDKIILASSYQSIVTLYPVFLSPIPSQISAYHYNIFTTSSDKYYVQDIGMSQTNDPFNPLVSVAGFEQYDSSPLHHRAWYGATGLNILAPMRNTNYSHQDNGLYEHYKIRYDQNGVLYTGGYFESGFQQCALFGTPGTNAKECDIDYHSEYPVTDIVTFFQFGLTEQFFLADDFITFYIQPLSMDAYDICDPFKSVAAPELAPTIEDESEIITFFDRITLKDTPTNTNYQIYNIMGQLIQAGTTNPDISTAQLIKGIYILRLENGKVFKFVK